MVELSSIERSFIRRLGDLRADGRTVDEGRRVQVQWSRNKVTGQTQCQVSLGDTVVLGVVNATAVAPFKDRPNEGTLKVNVTLSGLAREDWDPNAKSKMKDNSHVSAALEHAIQETKAVDLEGLCILSGRKVWHIQVEISILNDGGNVVDCGCLAAFGALSHFRRPDVGISGDTVKIYSIEEREPVPLSLHHIPMCISFALFRPTEEDTAGKSDAQVERLANQFFLLDPTDREELSCDGMITIIVNAHREVCGIHKRGWPPLANDKLMKLIRIACERAPELAKELEQRS